ncbi:MAG: helix-turn-helix transcriptional regulator [Bacteroidetes bacterium]|nr:helix-turn-helix transcriptional regulator [Bacteroidota bacterium]
MASYCPYCHSVYSAMAGDVYCSRSGEGMEKPDTGTLLIKTPKMDETDWHVSRLSVNRMLNGVAHYRVGDRECTVTSDNFLVINQGQTYKTSFEGREDAEMMTVGFRPGFAEGIFQSLTNTEEWLLDNPVFKPNEPLRFFEKTYKADPVITSVFQDLREVVCSSNDAEGYDLEDKYTDLLERLMEIHFDIYSDIRTRGYVKPSTGIELYKRISMARDYIDSNYTRDILLEDIAQNCCLSVSHLKRLFKEYFHITPHQYIIQRRLEKARTLLIQSDMPVRNICGEIGFENTSSFIRLFRNSYNLTPMSFRGRSLDRSDF